MAELVTSLAWGLRSVDAGDLRRSTHWTGWSECSDPIKKLHQNAIEDDVHIGLDGKTSTFSPEPSQIRPIGAEPHI